MHVGSVDCAAHMNNVAFHVGAQRFLKSLVEAVRRLALNEPFDPDSGLGCGLFRERERSIDKPDGTNFYTSVIFQFYNST